MPKDTIVRISKTRSLLNSLYTGTDLDLADLIIEVLSVPIQQLNSYVRILQTLSSQVELRKSTRRPRFIEEISTDCLEEICSQLHIAVSESNEIISSSKITRQFWLDPANLKYRKVLCKAGRILVSSSRETPIWTSSSVTQPMVILFNDSLAVWSQISLSIFPLRLLWITEFNDPKKLTIKLPEEEVSFSFPSITERDHWSSLIVSTVSLGSKFPKIVSTLVGRIRYHDTF